MNRVERMNDQETVYQLIKDELRELINGKSKPRLCQDNRNTQESGAGEDKAH